MQVVPNDFGMEKDVIFTHRFQINFSSCEFLRIEIDCISMIKNWIRPLFHKFRLRYTSCQASVTWLIIVKNNGNCDLEQTMKDNYGCPRIDMRISLTFYNCIKCFVIYTLNQINTFKIIHWFLGLLVTNILKAGTLWPCMRSPQTSTYF